MDAFLNQFSYAQPSILTVAAAAPAALRFVSSVSERNGFAHVMLKTFLQGKWLGHPLHPALVHIPTGLFPSALLFDILSRSGAGGNSMVRVSFFGLLLGLIVAALAAPAGLADWLEIKPGKPAYRIGIWHMVLNIFLIVVEAINLALRWNTYRWQVKVDLGPLTLSAVGTGILLISGYLGSMMVFDQGIGVARMSKKKWRKLAIEGRANVSEES